MAYWGRGLLRDNQGKWLWGFSKNLGHTTSTQAKLWAVRKGLTSSWNIGYKQIILKIDTLMVIKMLATNMEYMSLVSTLVFYCRDLLIHEQMKNSK